MHVRYRQRKARRVETKIKLVLTIHIKKKKKYIFCTCKARDVPHLSGRGIEDFQKVGSPPPAAPAPV